MQLTSGALCLLIWILMQMRKPILNMVICVKQTLVYNVLTASSKYTIIKLLLNILFKADPADSYIFCVGDGTFVTLKELNYLEVRQTAQQLKDL